LSVTYNDGRPIEPEKLYQTRDELVAQFGAVSLVPHPVLGVWVREGARYEDELRRLTVDVDDTPENQHFFAGLKARLCERFEQIEIYIVSYPVDIV
jgi:hypothetical protein